MAEHPWPLKNKLPEGHRHFTKADLLEIFEEAKLADDDPIWIDNYWQIRRQITQRPIEVMYIDNDGFHIG
jgi:hypothetical protein